MGGTEEGWSKQKANGLKIGWFGWGKKVCCSSSMEKEKQRERRDTEGKMGTEEEKVQENL